MMNNLLDFGFTTLEANFLALGHTLELEDEHEHKHYKINNNFGGFTLIEATLQKGVKNALWSFTEYEYEY